MNEAFHDLGGQRFFVRTWGDPALPKLLALHGFPEYGGAWSDLAHRLSTHFHVIAPDQRGYGQSWAPPEVEAYQLRHLVADMAALIGDEDVTVLGHDWGSSVAYGLAFAVPERVSKLVIANGVHPVPFQRALAAGGAQTDASQYIHLLRKAGAEDKLAENDHRNMFRFFSTGMDMSWLTPEKQTAYLREWSRPGRLKAMINWYRASPLTLGGPGEQVAMPDLPLDRLHVQCPHLLIWGPEDTALLPEATEGLEEFAADLTRRDVAGTDHWLIHQKPDDIAELVLSFAA
jgi:pimeloyl-ACP methyl ester carboxylesterase